VHFKNKSVIFAPNMVCYQQQESGCVTQKQWIHCCMLFSCNHYNVHGDALCSSVNTRYRAYFTDVCLGFASGFEMSYECHYFQTTPGHGVFSTPIIIMLIHTSVFSHQGFATLGEHSIPLYSVQHN
jgi:hypothetical protein